MVVLTDDAVPATKKLAFFQGFAMAYNNNRQNVRIRGNSNVVGNNNIVSSRLEEHHHHHGGSSGGGSSEDDAKGIGFGILAAVLVTSWLFVRHSEEVYFYIKLGALTSTVPFLVVIVLSLFQNTPESRQILATIFGFALSVLTFFLALYGQNSLDPSLLQFSQQTRDAWTFWKGLTEHGHNLVIGGLTGAICLGTAVFFSLLMGVFVLWHFLVDIDVEDSILLRALNPFRPSRGGIFAAILLLFLFILNELVVV